MKKKLIISLIAVVLVLSVGIGVFAACNKKEENNELPVKAYEVKSYDDAYEAVLGDFADALALAKTKIDTNERYAYMALAEAKFLEAGAYLPTTSQGGSYALSRLIPYSVSPVLFGNDSNRMYTSVVADKLISAADRAALKALYAEKKGTGTYLAAAKAYLTGHGYSLANERRVAYSEEPQTWDITDTFRTVDAEAIVQTYDGLVMYDVEGVLQPALAEALPEISEDGKTYTFHIKHGIKWVNQSGQEVAEVTANDWVYGMERILKNGESSSLVTDLIVGADNFANAKTTDFATVGVKAIDNYTLEYKLINACPYFITLFTYNPFAPVYKTYAVQQGEDYGKDEAHILYNGPYIVKNVTKESKMVFEKNAAYWNASAINVDKLTWVCYPTNDDPKATYNDLVHNDKIDAASLNLTTIELAKAEKLSGENETIFNKYVYISETDATAFGFFFNVNRQSYSTDGYEELTSKKTENQKNLARWALGNKNFRLAFSRAIDRAAYNAVAAGEDLKEKNLQNMYTPGTFVQLSADVEVEINGIKTTFKAGTYYGEIAQAQINADLGADAPQIWNPEADGGIGSSGGYDGWYNEAVAKKYLNIAIAELAEEGITVNKENPIHLEYVLNGANANHVARAQAVKQNLERVFDSKVIIDLVETSSKGRLECGYYQNEGSQCNYDVYDVSGWGPDYGDPATYLNTMMAETGDMIKMTGLY